MFRRRSMLVPIVLAVLIGSTPARGQQPLTPKRVALIVGVGDYDKREFTTLRQTENDADGLVAELRTLEFDKVVVMKGSSPGTLRATAANITEQLKDLLRGVTKNDVVLLALSGHGQRIYLRRPDGEEVEEDFFCPVEAVDGDASTMLRISALTDDILSCGCGTCNGSSTRLSNLWIVQNATGLGKPEAVSPWRPPC